MTQRDADIATVRAAVGTAQHTMDGTSAAFERILELKRVTDALEDAENREIERSEFEE
jgi:hypothetical protein